MNLAQQVNSTRLGAQPFTILRPIGTFGLGGFTSEPTSIPAFGIVTPATSRDMLILPEALRVSNANMLFHSSTQMREAQEAANGQPARGADLLVWNGQQYKVMYVYPWESYGYSKAIAVFEST